MTAPSPQTAILWAALWLWGPASPCAAQEDIPIERKLADLYLGDEIDDIQSIYRPAQEWPSHIEPRGRVTRFRVERAYMKSPPRNVETLWLGMKKGRLAEIQIIYDSAHTRRKPVEALAGELASIYGEPQRSGNRFWWSDGRTVLRVFYAEVALLKGRGRGVELRTSIQVMEEGLFLRTD